MQQVEEYVRYYDGSEICRCGHIMHYHDLNGRCEVEDCSCAEFELDPRGNDHLWEEA